MIWQLRSTDSTDTERIGAALGRLLKPPAVLELRSDLGGGKTTFTRGLASGLGSQAKVGSPTFTLSKLYKADHLEIHHFDFYRLSDPGIVSDQLEESLQNGRVVTVIEWSDIVKGVLPDDRLVIEFKPMPDNPDERQLLVHYTEKHRGMIAKLESILTEPEP